MSLTFSDTNLTVASSGLPTGAATAAKQDTGNTSLATIATMVSGAMVMVGLMVKATASFTRPADTTAYALGDVVSNSTSATTLMTFSGAGRSNANTGYITKARLLTSQATNTASFRLWLWNANNPTVAVDNAAYVFTYADDSKLVGYIDFPACSTSAGSGTGSFTQITDTQRLAYVCAAADTALYGFLETRTAFTPANAQTFQVTLHFDQN